MRIGPATSELLRKSSQNSGRAMIAAMALMKREFPAIHFATFSVSARCSAIVLALKNLSCELPDHRFGEINRPESNIEAGKAREEVLKNIILEGSASKWAEITKKICTLRVRRIETTPTRCTIKVFNIDSKRIAKENQRVLFYGNPLGPIAL